MQSKMLQRFISKFLPAIEIEDFQPEPKFESDQNQKFEQEEEQSPETAELVAMLGFQPTNINHYKLALRHKLASNGKGNNERLEFLGDAVLSSVVADFLYNNYKTRDEGYLTNLRSKIVKRETLNVVAKEIGLDKLVNLPIHTTSHNLNVYGNAFEALIGAIYLDKGYEQCKKFVYDVIFAKYISVKKLEKATENFKSQLLEWSQKRKINVDFEIIDDVLDAENNHIFKCAVKIDGKVVANGNGYSKKESQQRAAKAAINFVKKHYECPKKSSINSQIGQ